jgi:hypothetical protein
MLPSWKIDTHDVSADHSFDYASKIASTDLLDGICQPGDVKPVAVIGFSLKFPQDATSTELFTSILMEGRCAVTDFPRDRIKIDVFYSTDANRKDTVC